jgi:hypothetical protein
LPGGSDSKLKLRQSNEYFTTRSRSGARVGAATAFSFRFRTPAAAPLPATLPLFASGLGAIGLIRLAPEKEPGFRGGSRLIEKGIGLGRETAASSPCENSNASRARKIIL